MPVYKKPYLQPYKGKSTRHTCPACKDTYSFTLYLNGNTGQPIHPTVGKCNHEIKCGYHYTPRQYFNDHPEKKNKQPQKQPTPQQSKNQQLSSCQLSSRQLTRPQQLKIQNPMQPAGSTPNKEPSTEINQIPYAYVKHSASYNSNFVQFLCNYFPKDKIKKAVEVYALGATKNNEVIFWQIDVNGKIRTGKIMQYNPKTGKRVKNKTGAINWVHNKLKKTNSGYDNFNLRQCYFGEHLLRLYPDKPVAIVEAEKTAVITSIVIPQYNWLAAGNLNGLNIEKSKVFEHRDIVLYPDAGCYEKWRKKMTEIRSQIPCQIAISELIEYHATPQEIEAGYDIADYIIQQLKAGRIYSQQQPRYQIPTHTKCSCKNLKNICSCQ
ncbi:MAG: hypothetical protein PWQ81_500 [Bacteroidota bacterium]|nr:hypothetical protein [Bacteroidota bacterium]MDK2837731.1 hypothetical protein [Bacteroidota bacterium]MDN5296487.1 hypothetical protein [Bacteroidota bacterium]MDN5305920.1 hypothetical protein [Bacteroidota bacterium]